MLRLENMKFLKAETLFFCILVDCYHCITDSVTPRRQPKKSLFKRTKYNVVFLVDSIHKLQK